MEVSTLQNTIRDLIADCVGIPVQWEDQPRDYIDPLAGAVCLLNMPTIVTLGRDGQKFEFVDPAPAKPEPPIKNHHTGHRLCTLTIKVESYDHTIGKTAVAWLERCRTRIGWRSSGDRLNVVGAALVRSHSPRDLPRPVDSRMLSVGVLDLLISVIFREQDPEGIQSIETFDLTTDVTP